MRSERVSALQPVDSSSQTATMTSSEHESAVDAKWLETVLERHHRETSVDRVVSVKRVAAVNKGDNYGSDISRLVLECILGNGDRVTRRLIVKAVPDSEMRAKFVHELGAFKKETVMLLDNLPQMYELLRDAGDLGSPLTCEVVYHRPYDMLIMEDLAEEGFKMGNRFTGVGLEEALLAMQELGRYHAASVAMRDKSLLDTSEYRYDFIEKGTETVSIYNESILATIIEIIEEQWGPEWKSYAEGLKKYKGNVLNTWKKSILIDENDLNVLLHGDYWVMNMMFKSLPNSKKPIGFRMIDFQMSYYGCFALDFQYFTNTSLQLNVRRDHFDDLINAYYASLSRSMRLLGLQPPASVEVIHEQIRKRYTFGLLVAMFMMPGMKTNPEDVLDIEELIKRAENDKEVVINKNTYLGKIAVDTLKYVLPEFRKNGVV